MVLVKKILSEIERLSKDERNYYKFYEFFGKVLKEGLYGDFENKEKFLELLRFYFKDKEKLVFLKEYKENLKEN